MANNIITAAYSSSNITYTKPAYQYDYGMILKFSGIELPQTYEVHFSNTEFCGESISQIGDETGVTIPDEMFLSGAPIYAWTYLHTGEDDGETVYKAVISVNKRAKPSDLEPTPVQQDAITQAIAALNVAVEQTAADVVTSGENAQAAENSAEAADGYADAAQGYASDASGYASSAQGYASDAQGYAQDAEQAAGSVLGLTADATVDANVGTPSVEVEVTTESDHKNMSFAFHNLKGVQGDPGDPGVGISSVVLNSDYTLTITLTNGVSYTTSSIRGEVGATPDLTIGTVSTLPEGSQATATITGTDEDPVLNLGIPVGDTGVGIASVEKTGTSGLVDTYTITYTNGTTSTFEVTNGQDGEITEDALEERLIDKADVITSSASGEIVTIADGGKNLPVVDLSVSLLPVQSGSGDPSPTNIRPISGWTGVEVYQSGKNLFDQSMLYEQVSWSIISFRLKPNTTYTMSTNMTQAKADELPLYFKNTGGGGGPSTNLVYSGRPVSVMSDANGTLYISFRRGSGTDVFANYNFQIELGSSATSYEPYNGKTYPISWQTEAGTVYGGSLDLTTGVLKVNQKGYVFNGTENWVRSGTYNGSFYLNTRDYHVFPSEKSICSHADVDQSFFAGYGYGLFGLDGSNKENFNIWIMQANTTLDEFNAYLADQYSNGTPLTAVLELKNPVTYQLTPVQIATLLGSNSFWSNGNGVVDLEYRCDTKLYIEQLTKPSEDDMTANANIASGKFFMIGNRLFLSTTAIAQGEQIVVGTNCSEVSLADALNQINA